VVQQRTLFHHGRADFLISDITALNDLLELTGDQAISTEPLVTAKAALTEMFSDENVTKLTDAVEAGTGEVTKLITDACAPVMSALDARISKLGEVDAARADPAFAGLKLQVAEVSKTKRVDVEGFVVFKSRAENVSTALETFGTNVSAKLVSAVGDKIIAAKAAGLGAFLPSFDEAEQAYSALSSGNMELAAIPPVADAIGASLEAAQTEMDDALTLNTDLRTDLAVILSNVEDRGLGAFEPFTTITSGFKNVDPLDLASQNEELGAQIAMVQDFLDRVDAGEFLNCNLVDGLNFAAVSSGGFSPVAAPLLQKQEIVSSDTQNPLPSMYCIQMNHVTGEDINTYKEALGPRDQPVLDEIERVKVDDEGRATNVSHWLATRYATWVGKTSDQAVCLPPADAVLNAISAMGGQISAVGAGELFAESCGGSEVLKRNVVLRMDGDKLTASCVSSSAVVEDMAFRLTVGALCEN